MEDRRHPAGGAARLPRPLEAPVSVDREIEVVQFGTICAHAVSMAEAVDLIAQRAAMPSPEVLVGVHDC